MLYVLFLSIQLLFTTNIEKDPTGTIEVDIEQFKNAKGHLLVSLFNSGEHFPDNEEKAFRNKKIKVTNESHQVVFENIPYGEYAIIFLHDENDNEKMDTNFVGAPQEGYGASNNAVNTFSAPKYSDAKFMLNTEVKKLSLKIFY